MPLRMWATVGDEAIMAATQALSPGTRSAMRFSSVRSSYFRGNQLMRSRRVKMPSFPSAFARCSPMPLICRTSVLKSAMAHATTFPIKNAKNRYLLYNSSEENTRNPSITKTGNRRQKNVTFGGLRS